MYILLLCGAQEQLAVTMVNASGIQLKNWGDLRLRLYQATMHVL